MPISYIDKYLSMWEIGIRVYADFMAYNLANRIVWTQAFKTSRERKEDSYARLQNKPKKIQLGPLILQCTVRVEPGRIGGFVLS